MAVEEWRMERLGHHIASIVLGVNLFHLDAAILALLANIGLSYAIMLSCRMVDGLGALLENSIVWGLRIAIHGLANHC